jgi:hypothetical protein
MLQSGAIVNRNVVDFWFECESSLYFRDIFYPLDVETPISLFQPVYVPVEGALSIYLTDRWRSFIIVLCFVQTGREGALLCQSFPSI